MTKFRITFKDCFYLVQQKESFRFWKWYWEWWSTIDYHVDWDDAEEQMDNLIRNGHSIND